MQGKPIFVSKYLGQGYIGRARQRHDLNSYQWTIESVCLIIAYTAFNNQMKGGEEWDKGRKSRDMLEI